MNKIIKNIILVVCGVLSFSNLFSQTNITAIQPGPIFTYYDLWNVTITSIGQTQGDSYVLEMTLSNAKDGLLLSASTSKFTLNSPVYSINRGTLSYVQPLTHQFGNNNTINQIVNSGGQFPAGEYFVKFSLKRITQNGFYEPVGNTSYTIKVADYSSLFLINPYNNDTIYEQFPLLTWVYSNSAAAGKNVSYQLRLYEVAPGQTPAEAVYYNPLFFEETDVRNTVLRYPPAGRALVKLKRYAWQVTAKIDGSPVKQSEIWSFVLGDRYEQPEPNTPKNFVYVDLYPGDEGGTALVDDNFLKIRYVTKIKDSDNQLTYKIFDSNNEQVLSDNEHPLTVRAGENRYMINLCPVDGVNLKPGSYRVEVTDEKQKISKMKFYHEPKEACK
ncbi:MAG: hypothetical protein POELPBGB_03621 [Bacteroidia bacterium]|nr:hypothetical protein [Bacteroidia bacterium]